MNRKAITFRWKENGIWYEKEIDRRPFQNLMGAMMKAFEGRNEISQKLFGLSEVVNVLEVDKDQYFTEDIPIIGCYLDNGKEKHISIVKKHHPAIWNILLVYCECEED